MAVFWVVVASIIRAMSELIAPMMEAARTCETLVNFYQTTRRYNPEDSHLCTQRHENLKSFLVKSMGRLLITVFRDSKPLNLSHCPDDGGSKDLRNVGKLLPDYTALQPRRQPYLY
jgi:hypothetical protein